MQNSKNDINKAKRKLSLSGLRRHIYQCTVLEENTGTSGASAGKLLRNFT